MRKSFFFDEEFSFGKEGIFFGRGEEVFFWPATAIWKIRIPKKQVSNQDCESFLLPWCEAVSS